MYTYIIRKVIIECNKFCGCGSDCRNRVVQNGQKLKLGVVKTFEKGWGVIALEPIEAGQFVCEYVGEVITAKEATRFGKKNILF